MLKKGLFISLIVLILDQITKILMVDVIMRPAGQVDTPFYTNYQIEVTPFFNLVMAWNWGVSFGIFNNGGEYNAILLSGLSVLIVIALLVWLRKAENNRVAWALSLIIGGALGNVVDRFHWGAVADFLDFHVAGYHWPAFNLADSAICIGAALLVYDALFNRPNSTKN